MAGLGNVCAVPDGCIMVQHVYLAVGIVCPAFYQLLPHPFTSGPRFVVPLGDKMVDFNEHFKLFLSTRNPTPNFPPDACAIVNEVNFTITRAGLTAQVG